MLVVADVTARLKGTLVVALAAVAAASGCGHKPLRVRNDGGSAGRGGGGVADAGPEASTCRGLDEGTCGATPGCEAQHCQVCPGAPTYAGCTPPGEATACPAEACVTPP